MLPTLARLSLNAAPVGAPKETALDGSETKQDTLLTLPTDALNLIRKYLLLGKVDEACKILTYLCSTSTLPCGERSDGDLRNEVYKAACAQLFGANTTPAVLALLSPKTVFGDWKQLFKMLCIAFSPNDFEPISNTWARYRHASFGFNLQWMKAREVLLNHRSESQPVAFLRDTPRATQRMLDEMLFLFFAAVSTAQRRPADATQKEQFYYGNFKYLLTQVYPTPEAAICWLLVNRGARFYRLLDDYLRGLLMERLGDGFEGVDFDAALYDVQDDIYLPEKLKKIKDDNAKLLISLQRKEREVKLNVETKDHFLVDAMLFSTPLLPHQYYTLLDEELRKILVQSKETDFDATKEKIMRLRTLGAIFDPSYGRWTQNYPSIFPALLGFFSEEGIRKRLLEWLFEENGDEIYDELHPPFGAIVVRAKQLGRTETLTENVWLGLVKAVYSRYEDLRKSIQLRSIFFSFLGHFKAVRDLLGPNGPLGDTDSIVYYPGLTNTTLMDANFSNPMVVPPVQMVNDYEVRTASQWMEHLRTGDARAVRTAAATT